MKTRKTERGAKQFFTLTAVRAAPFALWVKTRTCLLPAVAGY
jgi:hypothetical protein